MKLSSRAAFLLQASLIVSFVAGSAAPTPLYALYQAAWGFSAIMVTIAFASYAIAVLATLLVMGSVSDYVGRRPVLFFATIGQIAAMVLYVTAHDVGGLIGARVVQGLATGVAAAAVGAGMLDLDKLRGQTANAVGPMLGTGVGSLLAGLLCTYFPAPTTLVYLVLAAIYLVQLAGIWIMPETVSPRPGALASLRPQLRVPPQVRTALLLAVPALIGAWALVGFFASLGPSLARRLAGSTSLLLGGSILFLFGVSAAATVFVLRARTARTFTLYGTAVLALGTAITLYATADFSLGAIFLGALVAGSGFGAAFQGAIRTVVPLAAAHERAGVIATLYVVSYLAFGLPAIAAGVRVVHGGGLVTTAREYGLAVIALATLAFVGTLRLPTTQVASMTSH